MWVLYDRMVATVINVILGIFLLIFIHNGREIYDKLHVSDDDAVTGQFKDFGKYEEMDDRADNKQS